MQQTSMVMGMGRADKVPEDAWPAVWGTTVQSRGQEFIPSCREEPWEVLALNRLMSQMEEQWIPQTGPSICLRDPTAGQSQLPEPLYKNPLCPGLWVDASHRVLNVTDMTS